MHAPVETAELRNSKKQMVSGTYLNNEIGRAHV